MNNHFMLKAKIGLRKHILKINNLPFFKKIILTISLLIMVVLSSWVYINIELLIIYDSNRATVENVLNNLSKEDYKNAYAQFAEKYKAQNNFANFKASAIAGRKAFLNYKTTSYKTTNTTRFILPLNPSTIRYIGTISYRDGSKAEIAAIFIWEKNEWKLYLIEFN